MTPFTKQVGENIRLCRMLKKFSQENVADMIGITATAFGKIERGESNASINRMEEIAKALSVLPEDLARSADFNANKKSPPLGGDELILLLKKISDEITLLNERMPKQMPDN